MSTDFGRYALSTPVEGLRQFITFMLDLGITPDEIRTMVKTNPERLLGLEPLDEVAEETPARGLPLEGDGQTHTRKRV